MTTVREATFEFLRAQGMTTVFGNPGSTELPMLADFPADFTYVLGLQESAAVGMADGYALASGRPTLVNLHTAPGVGNAMGAIFNAQANKSPLVITAGQQARSLMTLQALLTNRDAAQMPQPLVKWSYEPPRAQDVPHAIARATHLASLPPRGPVFVSIPMDDWAAEAEENTTRFTLRRTVSGAAAPDPAAIRALARRLEVARSPVFVAGADIDACGAWDAAAELAERLHMPVWAGPAGGSGRIGFPEGHMLFQGVLPPAVALAAQVLEGHDLVLAVGLSVFPYYPNIPGPLLPDGTALVQITNDPDEAARAPMGDAIVADPRLALEALLDHVELSEREAPAPRPAPVVAEDSDPMSASTAAAVLAEVLPDNAIVTAESPSATGALRNQLRLSRPGSWYLTGGGGLGFGLPAAIGMALAVPERRVVSVVGEGSAQYAIQALWTAATYRVPVTILVLRNDEYAILKWFGALESVEGAPGLDLPALDTVAVATGYGVDATRADGPDELATALRDAFRADGPRLVEARVAPGMVME
jgi:benzoylformate decarboxylase